MPEAETRALARETLGLGAPCSFTIGEVRDAIAGATGIEVSRAGVERALLALVARGEAMIELRAVTRNGREVPNARHFYAPRPKPEGCGTCPPCRDGKGVDCDPFYRLLE